MARQAPTQLMLVAMPAAQVTTGPTPEEIRSLRRTYRELLKQGYQLIYETDNHFQRARKEAGPAEMVPTPKQIQKMGEFVERLRAFEVYARSIDPIEQRRTEEQDGQSQEP